MSWRTHIMWKKPKGPDARRRNSGLARRRRISVAFYQRVSPDGSGNPKGSASTRCNTWSGCCRAWADTRNAPMLYSEKQIITVLSDWIIESDISLYPWTRRKNSFNPIVFAQSSKDLTIWASASRELLLKFGRLLEPKHGIILQRLNQFEYKTKM